MKANEANLLKVLKKSPQFIIPIYQRNYSWTKNECQQLWDDILRAGNEENDKPYFLGSIVYIKRALSTVSRPEACLVIDGQQRLTTCTLLIAALANFIEKNQLDEVINGFSARKLRHYYLLNSEEEGEDKFKLILSDTDKETLLAIIQNTPLPEKISVRVDENYQFFCRLIEENADNLKHICRGLDRLTIVEVALDRREDNPQLIFESMNSTGLALSQADLIRNYLLMGLEADLQTALYRNYWRKIEDLFGQEAYSQRFDAFVRHYLTVKTGNIPNISQVYQAFKQYAHSKSYDSEQLVKELHVYAKYYCAFALSKEENSDLKQAFDDLNELKSDVTYPLLFELYHAYQTQKLSLDEMKQLVRLIESYVFRRAVCGYATNSLNKTFVQLMKSFHKNPKAKYLQAEILALSSYRVLPSDEEFTHYLTTRDVYNFARRLYLLRKLENHRRKEKVAVEAYSIEHVLPQNPNLSESWQRDLGENWQAIQQQYLHTLGNLTLTAYNSKYSDKSFATKCHDILDKDGNNIGLAHSPLYLNEFFRNVESWNEEPIKERTEYLAQKAVSRPNRNQT